MYCARKSSEDRLMNSITEKYGERTARDLSRRTQMILLPIKKQIAKRFKTDELRHATCVSRDRYLKTKR